MSTGCGASAARSGTCSRCCPALAALGVEPVFVGLDDPAWDPEPFYERAHASSRCACGCRTRLDPRLVGRLRGALGGADIVHTHLVHADVYGALARGDRTLVSTKHNDDPFRRGPVPLRRAGAHPPRGARDRDHRGAPALQRRACRPARGEARGRPLRARRAARAVGRERGARPPGRCARPARDLAPRAAEGARRRRARARPGTRGGAARRARRARRGAGAASGSPAKASTCPGASATSAPGSRARSCSSTRRAGRGSASPCSRRCSPGSPWSPRGSARSRRSWSTARRACSCRRTTPRRSPAPSCRCCAIPGGSARPASRGRGASSRSSGCPGARSPSTSARCRAAER